MPRRDRKNDRKDFIELAKLPIIPRWPCHCWPAAHAAHPQALHLERRR